MSKGESRNREVQRTLNRLVAAAADDHFRYVTDLAGDDAQSHDEVKCTTCRDMCVQQVTHLLLQVTSVDHDLELVRASFLGCFGRATRGRGQQRPDRQKRPTLKAYARRMGADVWASTSIGSPPVEECKSMPFSQLAADFRLNIRGSLIAYARRNRAIISAPSSPATPGARGIGTTAEMPWSGFDLGRAPRMRGGAETGTRSLGRRTRVHDRGWWKRGSLSPRS